MFKVATAAAFVVLAAATAAEAGTVTDCKVISPDRGGSPVELVLPVKGSGILDFHFSFPGGHARSGGDTKVTAVCKVDEKKDAAGRTTPVFSTVYRAEVRGGVSTVRVEMPTDKGASARVSVVVGRDVYYGRLVAGATRVEFGGETPETSWKPE